MSQTRVINGPHIRTDRTTRNVMMNVAISLVPALLGAIYFFGIRALYLAGLSITVCVLTEFFWQKITKKQVTAGDFSAVVTGLLLVLNMPVTVPIWTLVAADVFSILVVKQMFGGIGNNFVNPALMGRLLTMVAWPGAVMQYVAPRTIEADAVSAATVLGAVKTGGEQSYSYLQMFLGETPGAMGETSKLLLLVGFAYMCYKGIVNAEAAFTYIVTVVALTFIFGPEGFFTGDIMLNLFGGGLIMGACYMLTDYVFVSRRGRILYAIVAGVITAAIRIFSVYPEGICFGILTANCMAGMMSLLYKKHIYGIQKKIDFMEEERMKNKNVRGLLALVVVTALSFGVILGSKALAKDTGAGDASKEAKVLEELDTKGAENIQKAVKTDSGYVVTVKKKGYASDIVMNVSFDEKGETIKKVEVTEQNETEGLGAKIADEEFLSQFEGVKAPVVLLGMNLEGDSQKESSTDELKDVVFADGTYEAKGEPSNGYTDQVNMTVKDGKITEVVWESVGEDGSKKSVLSENGEYVMTENGPTWKEQAEAMAAALVENQSLDFAKLNEQGKTDAVSGVSISVGGFVDLAQQCMEEAAGITETLILQDGTYEAKGEPSNGYTDQVNMTVKDGKITEVVWESVGEDGGKKSVLSENGEYVMTENGPTWKEQAEAMAAALVENQSLEFAKLDEQGKTDAVSGVSISVGGFVDLAQQCLNQAAGIEEATEQETETSVQGTQVDAVSGATVSSTAAVTAINDAYAFLQTVK